MAKYALINFRGDLLKSNIEWDGKITDGLYAKAEGEYYLAAELWPMEVATKVHQAVSAAQALVKQAEDNHAKIYYGLRNALMRGELK